LNSGTSPSRPSGGCRGSNAWPSPAGCRPNRPPPGHGSWPPGPCRPPSVRPLVSAARAAVGAG
jgi:hypothetical protein